MDLKEEIKNSIKLSEVIGKNLSLKKGFRKTIAPPKDGKSLMVPKRGFT